MRLEGSGSDGSSPKGELAGRVGWASRQRTSRQGDSDPVSEQAMGRLATDEPSMRTSSEQSGDVDERKVMLVVVL